MTVSGHDNDEEGIANAVDGIGSGQKTESGLGETGIDPRVETGLPERESERDGIGSNPKIATVRGRTATEKTTTQPRTVSGARARTTAMVTTAVRPRAGSMILPCSSIRRSGNTGGSRKGAVLRSFSRLIMSQSVLR